MLVGLYVTSVLVRQERYLRQKSGVVLQRVVDHLLCRVQMGQQLAKLHR